MKNTLKKTVIYVLAAVMLISVIPTAYADNVYTPPTDVIRVGLYYTSGSTTSKSFTSANLQNVNGCGYGYEFGYFDANRQFVSLGASVTDTNTITMIVDRNVYYNPSTRSYIEGTTGSVVVGCFHIELSDSFGDYESANTFMASLGDLGVNTFIKYANGLYYICIGSYTSSADASAAASALGIAYSYSITSGTAYTVTVVETGTNKIRFEFDCGGSFYLAVRPIAPEGTKALTYYKDIRYYGDFCYVRTGTETLSVVNYVNVEDYVKGVIPYEMIPSWPIEALKALAVCARTYAMFYLNKHSSLGYDVCNTTDCQVYCGTNSANDTTDAAVDGTKGMYLTYDGKLCETFYYSSNGGASESSENVWNEALPYLVGVIDPYEEAVIDKISNYNWTVAYTGSELAEKLRAKGYSCSTITKFEILEFTPTENVKRIRFTDSNGKTFTFSKENCRLILGLRSQRYTINGTTAQSNIIYVNSASSFLTSLFSSLFGIGSGGISSLIGDEVYAITGSGDVEKVESSTSSSSSGDKFVITGSGWGHNVGMSQWGAYSMAAIYGKTYEEILTFYYSNTVISRSE